MRRCGPSSSSELGTGAVLVVERPRGMFLQVCNANESAHAICGQIAWRVFDVTFLLTAAASLSTAFTWAEAGSRLGSIASASGHERSMYCSENAERHLERQPRGQDCAPPRRVTRTDRRTLRSRVAQRSLDRWTDRWCAAASCSGRFARHARWRVRGLFGGRWRGRSWSWSRWRGRAGRSDTGGRADRSRSRPTGRGRGGLAGMRDRWLRDDSRRNLCGRVRPQRKADWRGCNLA